MLRSCRTLVPQAYISKRPSLQRISDSALPLRFNSGAALPDTHTVFAMTPSLACRTPPQGVCAMAVSQSGACSCTQGVACLHTCAPPPVHSRRLDAGERGHTAALVVIRPGAASDVAGGTLPPEQPLFPAVRGASSQTLLVGQRSSYDGSHTTSRDLAPPAACSF